MESFLAFAAAPALRPAALPLVADADDERADAAAAEPLRALLLVLDAHELVLVELTRRLPGADWQRAPPRLPPREDGVGMPVEEGFGDIDLDPMLGSLKPLLPPVPGTHTHNIKGLL